MTVGASVVWLKVCRIAMRLMEMDQCGNGVRTNLGNSE